MYTRLTPALADMCIDLLCFISEREGVHIGLFMKSLTGSSRSDRVYPTKAKKVLAHCGLVKIKHAKRGRLEPLHLTKRGRPLAGFAISIRAFRESLGPVINDIVDQFEEPRGANLVLKGVQKSEKRRSAISAFLAQGALWNSWVAFYDSLLTGYVSLVKYFPKGPARQLLDRIMASGVTDDFGSASKWEAFKSETEEMASEAQEPLLSKLKARSAASILNLGVSGMPETVSKDLEKVTIALRAVMDADAPFRSRHIEDLFNQPNIPAQK